MEQRMSIAFWNAQRAGYTAAEIAAALAPDAAPAPAQPVPSPRAKAACRWATPPPAEVLKALNEAGLGMELVANGTGIVDIAELRAAGCKGVPPDEVMENALSLAGYGEKGIAALAGLSSIDASRQGLADSDGAALLWAAAIHCGEAQISELVFARNTVGLRTASAASQWLRFNRSISSLDLHDNLLDDEAAVAIAESLRCNQTLRSMRLSNNRMAVGGAAALVSGIEANLGLEKIIMETPPGAPAPGIDLAPLKGRAPAHLLDFGSKRLGPLSACLISQLVESFRPEMTALELGHNPILGEGAAAIADMLRRNDDIRELDLRFCAIGPTGATSLASALRVNTSVERALLLSNQIGVEGAKAIEEMLPHNKALRYISLQDNHLSPEAKESLAKAMARKPGLVVKV